MKKILMKIRRYIGMTLAVITLFVIGTALGGLFLSYVGINEARQSDNADNGVEIE